MENSFEKIIIAEYGTGSHKCYRIPGLIQTAKDTLVVYYEARLSGDDWDARNILIRRSTDNGHTWSEPVGIFEKDPDMTVNNPVMIACKDGTVHLLWNTDYRRCYHQVSRDDGVTFSSPREITDQLLPYRKQYPWVKAAFGPCHGIELKNGRLLTPMWLCSDKGMRHQPSVVCTLASDDGGETWLCGDIIGSDDFITNPNETCIAQLSDGRVMLNIRHVNDTFYRAVSISEDGLTNFSYPVLDYNLPDPICNAGLDAAPNGDLYFSNCASGDNSEGHVHRPCTVGTVNMVRPPRKYLTVRKSTDMGKTWCSSIMIEEYSAYSDVLVSNDGKWVYCFYEKDWEGGDESFPHQLALAIIPVSMLD